MINRSNTLSFVGLNLIILLISLNGRLILTLSDSGIVMFFGVETLSMIKAWIVLPMSLLFFVAYNMLVNRLDQKMIFQGTLWGFILFVFVYWYLYLCDSESRVLFIIFYGISELWSVMMYGILFWQFVNTIYGKKDVKKIYWWFQIMASVGTIIAGQMIYTMSDDSAWKSTVNTTLFYFSIFSICISALYSFVCKNISIDLKKFAPLELPYLKSLKLLFTSPVIVYLLTIVIFYECLGALTEIIWKCYAKKLFVTPCLYNVMMGRFSIWLGLSTITLNLLNGIIFKQFTLKKNTNILLYSIAFFVLTEFPLIVLYQNYSDMINILKIIVYLGFVQQIFLKGVKYALFDPAKERQYIAMSGEYKTKGKALIDSFGNRFGRTIGGVFQHFMCFLSGNVDFLVNSSFFISGIVLSTWFFITNGKGKYKKYRVNQEKLRRDTLILEEDAM